MDIFFIVDIYFVVYVIFDLGDWIDYDLLIGGVEIKIVRCLDNYGLGFFFVGL